MTTLGKRSALVIGCSNYLHSALRPLAAPEIDAASFARVLRDPSLGHFDTVTTLINKRSSELLEAIEAFYQGGSQNDLLLLYFSGHGLRDDLNRLYLATTNTLPGMLRSSSVPTTFLNDVAGTSRSQCQVTILDCCFGGAVARSGGAKAGESIDFADRFAATGSVVLTASTSSQFAYEGDTLITGAEPSVFTKFLVDGIESGDADLNSDGAISVDELYEFAFERVTECSKRQTPGKWIAKLQLGEIVIANNPRAIQTSTLAAGCHFRITIAGDLREWGSEGLARLVSGISMLIDGASLDVTEVVSACPVSLNCQCSLEAFERLMALHEARWLEKASGLSITELCRINMPSLPLELTTEAMPDSRRIAFAESRRQPQGLVELARSLIHGEPEGVVCRLSAIAGHTAEAEEAERYLTPFTSSIAKCAVYVTRDKNGALYLHSNFVTPGYMHPTKIQARGIDDLLVLVMNIIGTELSDDRCAEVVRAHARSILYIINRCLLFPDGSLGIELHGAENVHFVDGVEDIKFAGGKTKIRGIMADIAASMSKLFRSG